MTETIPGSNRVAIPVNNQVAIPWATLANSNHLKPIIHHKHKLEAIRKMISNNNQARL